jgi:hypothetical protein
LDPPNVGTLQQINQKLNGVITSGGTLPATTLDPDFRKGLINSMEFFADGYQSQTTGSNIRIPTVQSGGFSALMGMIMRIDSFPAGSDATRNLLWDYDQQAARGIRSFVNTSLKTPGFGIWQGVGDVVTIVTDIPFTFGVPFAVIFVVDVQAGKLQVLSSIPGAEYKEVAWSVSTNWAHGSPNKFSCSESNSDGGDAPGFAGVVGQVFTAQWVGTLDAEISAANMTNFLEFCDGFKVV